VVDFHGGSVVVGVHFYQRCPRSVVTVLIFEMDYSGLVMIILDRESYAWRRLNSHLDILLNLGKSFSS